MIHCPPKVRLLLVLNHSSDAAAAVSQRWFSCHQWKGKALLKQVLWSGGTAHAGALIGGQLNASKLAYKNQVKCKRNLNLI